MLLKIQVTQCKTYTVEPGVFDFCKEVVFKQALSYFLMFSCCYCNLIGFLKPVKCENVAHVWSITGFITLLTH